LPTWCTRRSSYAREVNLPSPDDGSRDPERVTGADQKPVPSGGHCRLSGQASGRFGKKARVRTPNPQSRASIYVPDGLIRHALPFIDDDGVSLRRLHPFRVEAREFELVSVLYVLYSKIHSEQLDRCFLEIFGASYGDKFADLAGPDDFTRLQSGVFWWLINIRPGYLIFQQGDSCTIMPSPFAQQFNYDQLYIGNPNSGLRFSGNLFEGAWVWYYSVAGGTRAIFSLPHRTPNCYASLGFCT